MLQLEGLDNSAAQLASLRDRRAACCMQECGCDRLCVLPSIHCSPAVTASLQMLAFMDATSGKATFDNPPCECEELRLASASQAQLHRNEASL